MILSGHQPVYLPGIIVMSKIALSDKFMFVGHCDYQPKSWHTRNYIRGANGPVMLSVPVRKGVSLNETVPLSDSYWRLKHLKSMELEYSKRPHFNDYYPEILDCIMRPVKSLSELNIGLIRVLMQMLDIDTPTYQSEMVDGFDMGTHKTRMLVSMCQAMGAKHYLSSPTEEDYVKPDEMNGYAHSYLKFTHPVYDQGHPDFMPNLSVIDLIFNMGPWAAQMVREAGNV